MLQSAQECFKVVYELWDKQHEIWNMKYGISKLKNGIWKMNYGIWNIKMPEGRMLQSALECFKAL